MKLKPRKTAEKKLSHYNACLKLGRFTLNIESDLPFPGLFAMNEYRSYIKKCPAPDPSVELKIKTGTLTDAWRKADFLFGHTDYWHFFIDKAGYWLVYTDREKRKAQFLKKGGYFRVKYQGINLVYRHRNEPRPTPGVEINPAPEYNLPDIEHVDKVAFMTPDMRYVKVWMKELPGIISPDDYFSDPLERPLLDFILQITLPRLEDGYLFHASAVDDGGSGYMFPGHSGNGKSTIADLWSGKARIMQEDCVEVRGRKGGARIFTVPEVGAVGNLGPSTRLAGIFALKHSGAHRITRLSTLEAVSILFYNIMKPIWDSDVCDMYSDYCLWLASHVPCFLLEFAPDPSVCELIRKAVSDVGKEKPAVISPFMGEKISSLKNFKGIPGVKF